MARKDDSYDLLLEAGFNETQARALCNYHNTSQRESFIEYLRDEGLLPELPDDDEEEDAEAEAEPLNLSTMSDTRVEVYYEVEAEHNVYYDDADREAKGVYTTGANRVRLHDYTRAMAEAYLIATGRYYRS